MATEDRSGYNTQEVYIAGTGDPRSTHGSVLSMWRMSLMGIKY